MKGQFEHFRPDGFVGKGDKFLFPLINQLEQKIAQLSRRFKDDTFDFDKVSSFIFSSLLVEFAEDLHNDFGLWNSIEEYNIDMFGTPLPTVIQRKEQITECFDVNRIKFFIINILDLFHEDMVLPPKNNELDIISRSVSNFLKEKFETIPKDSGIKHFLQQPNEYAWDIKGKLVWACTKSYLFRNHFFAYAKENNEGKFDIPILEEFMCQERTIWSGLGVLDIVAMTLNLDEKKKNNVRDWNERLTSFYRVKENKGHFLLMENLINNQSYHVHLSEHLKVFKIGEVFMGSLVPFGDYFYWSGMQQVFGKLSADQIKEAKNEFIEKGSKIVYRYDKELLAKAQKVIKERYDDFVSLYQDDLVIFKDGLSMAAAFQKYDRQKWETLSKEELKKLMEKNNSVNPFPQMDLPDYILNSTREIGVYNNPVEGIEIIIEFDDLKNGLQKHFMKLKEDERFAIWQLITSDNISVNYVHKLIKKYGSKSIATIFFIENEPKLIEYLLHKYKGHFYLNRYPTLSFAAEDD